MKAEVGKRYRHYKNKKEYIVIAVGYQEEPLEEVVIYEAQYATPDFGDRAVWVRPKSMFEEEVEFEGGMVPRFKLID
jgi:hypothetical protein